MFSVIWNDTKCGSTDLLCILSSLNAMLLLLSRFSRVRLCATP